MGSRPPAQLLASTLGSNPGEGGQSSEETRLGLGTALPVQGRGVGRFWVMGQAGACQPVQIPGLENTGGAIEEHLGWQMIPFRIALDYGNVKTYLEIEGWYTESSSTRNTGFSSFPQEVALWGAVPVVCLGFQLKQKSPVPWWLLLARSSHSPTGWFHH